MGSEQMEWRWEKVDTLLMREFVGDGGGRGSREKYLNFWVGRRSGKISLEADPLFER